MTKPQCRRRRKSACTVGVMVRGIYRPGASNPLAAPYQEERDCILRTIKHGCLVDSIGGNRGHKGGNVALNLVGRCSLIQVREGDSQYVVEYLAPRVFVASVCSRGRDDIHLAAHPCRASMPCQ